MLYYNFENYEREKLDYIFTALCQNQKSSLVFILFNTKINNFKHS